MNVLSLFDGATCGLVALKREGIKVDNYFASEVDPWAIKIAMKNHPEIIQLGDIQNYKSWDLPKIDLVIGGPPCQDYSLAGKGEGILGKRGVLTKRFLDCIDYFEPENFLMEQVVFKGKHKPVGEYLIERLKTNPVAINSNLVSAQNRERAYWCNWKIEQPEDKDIMLNQVVFQFPHGGSVGGLRYLDKSPTVSRQYHNNYFPCDVEKLALSEKALLYMDKKVKGGRNHWDFKHHSDVRNNKSAAVVANFFKGVPYNVLKDWDVIRKFHPVECERLQTLPDNYTEGVSNTQRYKMIGNGWTVDVIAHILRGLNA